MKLAALAIVLAIPCLAQAADSVPKLAIETSCKAATSVSGDKSVAGEQTYDSCMKDENDAADEVSKIWSNYSAPTRTRCEGEAAGELASYVDLLVCLQVATDNGAAATPMKVTTLKGASKRRAKR
ncbi:MAG: hypothetical protein ACXWLD_04965 [Rhizomicrobium sp.]